MHFRLWIANGDLTFLKRVRSGDVRLVQPLCMRQSVSLSKNQGMLVWHNLALMSFIFTLLSFSRNLCVAANAML